MSGRVSPADRKRDLVAVSLLVVGAALFLYGFLGLRGMATKPIVAARGHSAVAAADVFWYLSRAGTAVIIAGVIAVAWSFWRHHRRLDEQP